MSGEVGQWDLESLCAVFFFLSPPSLLILSCQWENEAMRLGEGKMMSYGE